MSSKNTTPETSPETSPDSDPSQPGNADNSLLSGAKDPTTWVSHPIDIRLSLPFVGTRFYMTIVAGRERRRPQRRDVDRESYPLATLGNALFTLGIATLFTVTAIAILIARSAIIE
ncbi:hypothetical protein ACFL12_08350 [Pseudomonadota bacterium]